MTEVSADTERFEDLFEQIYQTFYRRRSADAYRPSRETMAVLDHLTRTGPLSIAEACDHFGRSQAAMSEIVSRLVERDLLARVPDERDRRRHLVWLTEAGRALHREETRVLDTQRVNTAITQLPARTCRELLLGLEALLASPSTTSESPKERP